MNDACPEPKPVIEVRDLTIGHGERTLLKSASFCVMPGEIFIIMGGSGSGKSTLMRHMIGLMAPFSGEILIHGVNVSTAQGEERRKLLRSFGVMYQGGALFGSLTLLENISLPLEEFTALPHDAIDVICRVKLKQVGLSGFGGHMPAELSGGMVKRAAIARAMALDPSIIFLDEPSAGLDPITSAELDGLIHRLSRTLGITFVIVTHELESVFEIADRVIMLDAATRSIAATGDPRKLRDASLGGSLGPWVKEFLNPRAPHASEDGRAGAAASGGRA